MNFESSYRRFRPLKFDQVVGQTNIVTTLTNAINSEKIGHAYLFNGPRGTGKTSIAKIFARNMNCQCNLEECKLCNYDSKTDFADIIEMDAASNNGVDEIRQIIDEMHYAPMQLKYKVYIIDEVHMLSKSAFNAILKTLEEPPAHVKFILATTEINKIPATILSRCQRFDFHRLSEDDIVKHLCKILDQQQISYEIKGIEKIAVIADGAMRDAFSLLDKVLMYNDSISMMAVSASLNIGNEIIYQELLTAILDNQLVKIIDLITDIYTNSVNEMSLIVDFQRYVRSILKRKIEQANGNESTYLQILKQLSFLQERLIYSKNPRILLEVYLCDIKLPNKIQTPIVTKPVSLTPPINKAQIIKPEPPIQKVEAIKPKAAIVQQEEIKPVIEEINYEDPTFEENDMQVDDEPILSQVVNQHQPSTVKKVETVVKQQSSKDIILYDVLKDATKEAKANYEANYQQVISHLKQKNLNGLAIFFERAVLVAASVDGLIFTIDESALESFNSRIAEITEYILEVLTLDVKVFLLSKDQWLKNRSQFVAELKMYQSKKDIYTEAQRIFGPEIVFKKEIRGEQ